MKALLTTQDLFFKRHINIIICKCTLLCAHTFQKSKNQFYIS